jgi:hypothetical protein
MDASNGGGDMLKALGSRLTYANVMATAAVFVALGGGAYALSGIPDRGGVFHGCVSNSTGVLRVVKSAGSCQKPKTVRRNGRRIRLPGEFAVSWNQRGVTGATGGTGPMGPQGPQGPGAVNLVTQLHRIDGVQQPLATVDGLSFTAVCGGFQGSLQVATTTGDQLHSSGTAFHGGTSVGFNNLVATSFDTGFGSTADIDGHATNAGVAKGMRIDEHIEPLGSGGGFDCLLWGIIVPSS